MSPDPISADLHDELFKSYFIETLKADSVARENAERAFTVASALAAALIAAGAALNFTEQSLPTKVVGLSALAAWLAASLAFMRAVGERRFPGGPGVGNKDQWGNQAIQDALLMRGAVYGRLAVARNFSAVAGGLTIITLCLAILGKDDDTQFATLGLSPSGQSAFHALCPNAKTLSGDVELRTLESQYLEISAHGGTCGQRSRTIRIRREDVVALGAGVGSSAQRQHSPPPVDSFGPDLRGLPSSASTVIDSEGRFSVDIGTFAEGVSGTATVSADDRAAGHEVRVATKVFQAVRGAKVAVRVGLSRQARRILAQEGHLRLHVRISASDHLGNRSEARLSPFTLLAARWSP